MKYTLIVGIKYKKFNKCADITLALNDLLIDSFALDKDYGAIDDVLPMIESKWYNELKKSHWIDPTTHNKALWEMVKLPKYIKIYKINEEQLGGCLTIKVENDNSDYTNGFMKNSSLIEFPLIGLFPSHMTDNDGEKLLKTVIRLDESYDPSNTFKTQTIKKLKQENIFNEKRNKWPLVHHFFVKRESKIHEESREVLSDHPLGGSFTIEIPVKRKHKVFFLGRSSVDKKGFFHSSNIDQAVASYKPLLNSYNEDT